MHEGHDECESDWMVGHPLTHYEAFRNVRMGASKLSEHQHKVPLSSSSKWDKIDKAKMKAKPSSNLDCARLPPSLNYLYIFILQDSVLGAFKVRWKRTDQLPHNVHTCTWKCSENWLRNMLFHHHGRGESFIMKHFVFLKHVHLENSPLKVFAKGGGEVLYIGSQYSSPFLQFWASPPPDNCVKKQQIVILTTFPAEKLQPEFSFAAEKMPKAGTSFEISDLPHGSTLTTRFFSARYAGGHWGMRGGK